MRTLLGIAVIFLFLLSACASAPQQTRYEAYCKTHARKISTEQTPVEESAYRDCLYTEGVHEIEVRKR